MNRTEALEAMKQGNKITHPYFTTGEYYELKGNKIIAEDGVNHTEVFWSTDGNNWRADNWSILKQ